LRGHDFGEKHAAALLGSVFDQTLAKQPHCTFPRQEQDHAA